MNFCNFDDKNDLATHPFVYYVRGIASDLKFPLAYFGTTGLTARQIWYTFWEAVLILELSCQLPVIACVCDGASSNRKFFSMHKFMDNQFECELVYQTVKIYAKNRYIWFLSDVPHLMKTLRNCIFHSGEKCCTMHKKYI